MMTGRRPAPYGRAVEPALEPESDIVIVGAGSAGCLLANRLSADPSCKVTLLEAGGEDRHPLIHVPAGYVRLLAHPTLTWGYATAPEAGLGGRRVPYPRGKVLGGSSAINGLGHVRGDPTDYDTWAQQGCRGWGHDDLLPCFKRHERAAPGGPGRGTAGELPVVPLADIAPVLPRLREAAIRLGARDNADMNGPIREGVAFFQQTRQRHRRVSAARAFLHPVRRRPNLRVVTRVLADRVDLRDGRAAGVLVRGPGPRLFPARAQVVLAAGAIGSPALLLRSGLGPAQDLTDLGIVPAVDLPGVGRDLQDHFMVRMVFHLHDHAWSANRRIAGWRLAGAVADWALRRRGPLTWSPGSMAWFARTDPAAAAPDVQIIAGPASFVPGRPGVPEAAPGLTLGVWQCRPDSRGWVGLESADPAAPPVIAPRYLSAPGDAAVLMRGLRLARAWMAEPGLRDIVAGEARPGASADTDEALLAHARDQGTTVYHPCGTVRMGTDTSAPLDPVLRVRGVRNLRVVDASVFPTLPVGNINATVLAVAEKGAELIAADLRG
jgi:choline dehydrogenase